MHSIETVISVAYRFVCDFNEILIRFYCYLPMPLLSFLYTKLCYFDNGYVSYIRSFVRLLACTFGRPSVRSIWESTSASVAMTLTQKITDTEYFFNELFKSTWSSHLLRWTKAFVSPPSLQNSGKWRFNCLCIHQWKINKYNNNNERTNVLHFIEIKRDQKYMRSLILIYTLCSASTTHKFKHFIHAVYLCLISLFVVCCSWHFFFYWFL